MTIFTNKQLLRGRRGKIKVRTPKVGRGESPAGRFWIVVKKETGKLLETRGGKGNRHKVNLFS